MTYVIIANTYRPTLLPPIQATLLHLQTRVTIIAILHINFEATIMRFEGFKSTIWSQALVHKQLILGKKQTKMIFFAIENIKFINHKA